MWGFRRLRPPRLSVVVIFHNMRRESERTLHSLTTTYQKDVSDSQYEVIAIDSSSNEPLDEKEVYSYGPQFRYLRINPQHPSPCEALNLGASEAKYDIIMFVIDGARILSPSIIKKTLDAFRKFKNPFVYTLGMHIGPKPQAESILDGYCQSVEDDLLKQTEWKENGYSLFPLSSLAYSSQGGYFSELNESNCFSLYKKTYMEIGRYNESFIKPGGGLCNLDIFNRAMENKNITPVILMGEATFHQYHGGVATNVPIEESPWEIFASEYRDIYKKEYTAIYKTPHYFGEITNEIKIN